MTDIYFIKHQSLYQIILKEYHIFAYVIALEIDISELIENKYCLETKLFWHLHQVYI